MLPDFLLLGAQKAGTTSLFSALCAHPGVVPGMAKEIHHFDMGASRPLRSYRACFPLRLQLAAMATIRRRAIRVGEATPEYLFDPVVPEAVARDLPDARFVVVLRDPVPRAYAHWRMVRARGHEDLPFPDALDAESERLDRARALLASDRSTAMQQLREWSYFARGRYAEQLERWFSHVERSRLLIVRFDDLVEDVDAELRRICAHLDLDPFAIGALPAENVRPSDRLDSGVEAELRRRFEQPNEELARLVGIDFNDHPEEVSG